MTDQSGSRGPREDGANDESLMDALRGWFRLLKRGKTTESVRETIEDLIEDRDEEGEAEINDDERRLLGNVLRLRDVTAADLMVPRADIVAIDSKATLSDLNAAILSTGHSRYPVFRGTLDEVIGLIHIKDVLMALAEGKPFVPGRIVRRVLFAAPSIRAMDLLLEMRVKRTHMALIVDEYGGIDGLITIEDLVEQIVGQIEDEHDTEAEPDLIEYPDGVIEADARTPIEELEARVGPLLDDEAREDVDTLGGLVFYLAGRVPGQGETISHPSGLEFEVLEADPRRIKRVKVRSQPDPTDRAA